MRQSDLTNHNRLVPVVAAAAQSAAPGTEDWPLLSVNIFASDGQSLPLPERFGRIIVNGRHIPVVCVQDLDGGRGYPPGTEKAGACTGCVGWRVSVSDYETLLCKAEGTEPKLVNCTYLPTCGGRYAYKVATPQNLAAFIAQRMAP